MQAAAEKPADVINPEEMLDLMEQAVDAGLDIFEESVSMGENIRRQDDDAKWIVGDLACLVQKKYGKNRISEWAKRIGWEVDRVKEYRTQCKFYPRSVRNEFWKNLPEGTAKPAYSKFRKAKRFGDMEVALDFLLGCPPEWTVERVGVAVNEALGKPTIPMKYIDFEAPIASAAAELTKHLALLQDQNKNIHIKGYEVK